jgi:hypothetical protein
LHLLLGPARDEQVLLAEQVAGRVHVQAVTALFDP